MVRGLFVLALLAACYAPPSAESLVTCETTCSGTCPGAWQCIEGHCRKPGDGCDDPVDGGPDGADVDTDGDGIVDRIDNCPEKNNPNQYNEDGDARGNACDPCPHIAGDIADDDPDDDKLGTACDPRPNMPGDALVDFLGFDGPNDLGRFTAMPSGSWLQGTGLVTLTVNNQVISTLRLPVNETNVYAVIGFKGLSEGAVDTDRFVGTRLRENGANTYFECGAHVGTGKSLDEQILVSGSGSGLGMPWAGAVVNTPGVLTHRIEGKSYECGIQSSTDGLVTGVTGNAVSTGAFDLVSSYVSLELYYVFIVRIGP